MRLGVHVSIAGGLTKALERAVGLGCETLQIFAGNPRSWRSKPLLKPEIAEFRKERERVGLEPLVVHMPYLANLAAKDAEILNKSIIMVQEQMERCELLGADYLVCHMGKADDGKAMDRMEKTIRKALGRRRRACTFLLETRPGRVGKWAFSWLKSECSSTASNGWMWGCAWIHATRTPLGTIFRLRPDSEP